MDILAMLLLLIFGTWVAYRLKIPYSIEKMAEVATREATAYNREHKVRVAKRYMTLDEDFDSEKVNSNIAKIDAVNFD